MNLDEPEESGTNLRLRTGISSLQEEMKYRPSADSGRDIGKE